ncbi:hypothetical protein HOH87_03055 [bacterium]|jgi:flagellar biosynthesis protein|nr:hypothetical protein [bacterium]
MGTQKKKELQKKREQIKKKLKKSILELNVEDRKKLQAIAVRYDTKKDRAPKIIATGKGLIAEGILQIAEENNVPLLEDSGLAEVLSKLDIESEIPPDLYAIVAEILAFIYQLDKMAKKRANIRKKFTKLQNK